MVEVHREATCQALQESQGAHATAASADQGLLMEGNLCDLQ